LNRIKEPVSAALGYFDGVHLGHAEVINKALSQGLKTAVVTFSHNPGKKADGRPVPEITLPALKEKILESMSVDFCIYLDFDKVRNLEPEEFIDLLTEKLNVKYISCGFNYRFGKGASADVRRLDEICRPKGIKVYTTEPVCVGGKPLSSTRIRSCIASGDVKCAMELLGRPFAVYGEVVHGRRLGRVLGTPTINQLLPPPQLLPRFGVYASVTHVGDTLYPSVTNIGVKPTVSSNEVAGSETYIIGFDGDLYGKVIQVDLIEFLRPEMKFESVDRLKEQMGRDTEKAKAISTGFINNKKPFAEKVLSR